MTAITTNSSISVKALVFIGIAPYLRDLYAKPFAIYSISSRLLD